MSKDYDEVSEGLRSGRYIIIDSETGQEPDVSLNILRANAYAALKNISSNDRCTKKDNLQRKPCSPIQFTFVRYKCLEDIFPILNPSEIFRTCYLGTCLTHDQCLATGNNHYIGKSQVRKVLKIASPQFYTLWNKLVDAGLIKDGGFVVLMEDGSFFKGTITKKKAKELQQGGYSVIKLYKRAVRELYTKSSPSDHKQLGYLFMLIPYVNIRHNIICSNPYEEEITQVKPLGVGQIAEVLKVKPAYIPNLLGKLETMTISVSGAEQKVIAVTRKRCESWDNSLVTINPNLLYGGTAEQKENIPEGLFQIKNESKTKYSK